MESLIDHYFELARTPGYGFGVGFVTMLTIGVVGRVLTSVMHHACVLLHGWPDAAAEAREQRDDELEHLDVTV